MSLRERVNQLKVLQEINNPRKYGQIDLFRVVNTDYFIIRPEQNLRLGSETRTNTYTTSIKNTDAILTFLPQFATRQIYSDNILEDVLSFVSRRENRVKNATVVLTELQVMSYSQLLKDITVDGIYTVLKERNNNSDERQNDDIIAFMFITDIYDPISHQHLEEQQDYYLVDQQLFEDDRYIKINIVEKE